MLLLLGGLVRPVHETLTAPVNRGFTAYITHDLVQDHSILEHPTVASWSLDA